MTPRPIDAPFAYLTHDGELLLLDEVCAEIDADLRGEGVDLNPPVIKAVVQAYRYVTERLRAGERFSPEELFARVGEVLQQHQWLLDAQTVERVGRALLDALRQADVSRVHYY